MILPSGFRLLTFHAALHGLASAMAGGFAGAFLLTLGLGIPAALAAQAAIVGLRFVLRFAALAVVRRTGLRGGLAAGTALSALGALLLPGAAEPALLGAWLLATAAAEALYWPAYHAATAATAEDGRLGRQVAERTAVGAGVAVVGPLAGGLLLAGFGEAAGFAIAATVALLSVLPLLGLGEVAAGPVPRPGEALRGDRRAMATFAADGWIAAGCGHAWPLLLFATMGASYQAFGVANALAGLAGAGASLLCGRAVDRGRRDRWLLGVCLALAASFALRAASAWSPPAALLANAAGAAIAGAYAPVVMSAVYARARRSGEAYRTQLAAEAAWDAGAMAGLVVAAAVAALAPAPSLAVLPAALGLVALHRCVRRIDATPPAGRLVPG